MPYPVEYLNRPEARPEFQHYLDAFYELSVSRTCYPGGFGSPGAIGFIPVAEIEAYCRMTDVLDPRDLMTIVRHLDRVYVEFQNQKLTASAKKN